ncbi:FHA domain-containing protein, partial [Kineococcus sp. T13]|uniref:FtsK/SpoIIIE domain-containing protein n=1 Tax=Kineococcus vitellinus TaxID=2696565 RepID=UPI0014123EC6|nr:FHA domain-containing protein [Kineococcus vitellinus]
MPFRLTVLGVDLEVDVPAGTPFADVRREVEGCTGPWPPGWEELLHVEGSPVAGAVLGLPPLVAGAHVRSVAAGDPAAGDRATGDGAAGGLVVHVSAGPDAGRRLVLGTGTHVVGRSGPLALADPSLSRRHAVLEVRADGAVLVSDAGSLNGTALLREAGRRALTGRTALRLPARVALGDTVLTVGPPAPEAAEADPDGAGRVLLNRAPRWRAAPAAPAAQVLRWPARPAPPRPPAPPVLALLVPLAVAGALALLWSPLSLLLGLASPVLVGGQWWSARRRCASEVAAAERSLALARADVRRRHRAALAEEHARAHDDFPDPAALLAQAERRGTRLYERRPGDEDHLVLRTGLGERAATSSSVRPADERGGEPVDPPLLRDVPVVVSLHEGALGVVGPREARLRVVRHLLAQVAAWHSPEEVHLVLVGPAGDEDGGGGEPGGFPEDWAWAAWLPHHHPAAGAPAQVLAALRAELEARRARTGRSGAPAAAAPSVVVVVDDCAGLRGEPALGLLLAQGPAHGIHPVCLAAAATGLPAECRTLVDLGAAPALVRTRAGTARARPDGVGAAWAERCARALAAVRDAGGRGGGEVPGDVRLAELLGPLDGAALARGWEVPHAGLRAVLGAGVDGPCRVDLAVDGPHALVAGTTGSGKSVLLQSLVASLAAGAPPDALQLVLVDYKGGAAFGACAGLPHVAGVVTDLDEQLAGRVLRSLRAEVRRRELVLARAGAADVADLPAGALARLVLVVDEFRVLSQELPAFVEELVRLAVVGRSLGLHLVLATQRPAGVVSPEIRANTNLRIALRVQERADAEDVVGDPAPAAFSDRLPGRALVRRGPRAPELVQAARSRGPRRGGRVRVRRADAPAPPAGELVDDLPVLVAAALEAARLRGRALPPAPWLPPLPARAGCGDLPAGAPDGA